MLRAVVLLTVALASLLPQHAAGKPLSVITTLFPLQEFAQAVGKENAAVELLLPPGAEPHTWEPRPSDIVKLHHADILIYISQELEPWMAEVLKSVDNPGLSVIEVAHSFSALKTAEEHRHGDPPHETAQHALRDPHIWLNFAYDQTIIDILAAAMSKRDPAAAPYYTKNASEYKQQLQALDQQYRKGLSACRNRQFIVGGHAAFAYLAERYGLQQIPLYGLSPNAEPSPKKMAELIDTAKRHQVKVIYFEQLVSDRLAKVIAREVGAETLALNNGANLTKEDIRAGTTFIHIMESNLEHLRYGLECQ